MAFEVPQGTGVRLCVHFAMRAWSSVRFVLM